MCKTVLTHSQEVSVGTQVLQTPLASFTF